MTGLINTFESSVPPERRKEWLENWQNTIQATEATKAESDCGDNVRSLEPTVKSISSAIVPKLSDYDPSKHL